MQCFLGLFWSYPYRQIPWTEEPGYSPWGYKESDTTDSATEHARILINSGKNCLSFIAFLKTDYPACFEDLSPAIEKY